MKLQFKSKHLSISQFNAVEFSNFTVLTGVNGSGKGHLSEAIERSAVSIAGIENPKIVRFNYESFKLENENAYNAQVIASEKESAWNYLQQLKPNVTSWKIILERNI